MSDVVKKCVALMGQGNSWLRWFLVLGLAIVVAGIEAVGAVLILVLLGMVTGEGDALELPVLGDVSAVLPEWEQQQLFLGMSAAIAVFFLARAGLMVAQAYVESRVVQNTAARLSANLLRGYLAMPYAYHLQRNSSQLIRNAHQSVNVIATDGLKPLLKITSQAILAAGMIVVLVAAAPGATLLAVGVLGPLVWVLLKVVQPRVKRQGRVHQDMDKATLQTMQQTLHGVRDVKTLGREQFFHRQFSQQRRQLARAKYLRDALKAVPRVGVETGLIFVIVAFFGVTVVTEGSAGGALPVLGLFAYAGLRLKPPLNEILISVNSLRFAGAALDDVHEDLAVGKQAIAASAEQREPAPLPFHPDIALQRVCFRYPGTDEDVLHDLDLQIHRGESLGLVGPTGGGKSTLVDMIVGLLEPTSGTVRVDGTDIRSHTRAWQRNIGMVPQSVFLVDDTLRRNIALGHQDDEIDAERFEQAIHMAQLTDVLADLPDGYETVVGERGVRLSGGQRQRVAIARALYLDPDVLIFDEGTSALDNRTEADLLRTLEEIGSQRTLITVAHRLTTVRNCDRILLIQGGRIVDQGAYGALARRNESFRALTQPDVPSPR